MGGGAHLLEATIGSCDGFDMRQEKQDLKVLKDQERKARAAYSVKVEEEGQENERKTAMEFENEEMEFGKMNTDTDKDYYKILM